MVKGADLLGQRRKTETLLCFINDAKSLWTFFLSHGMVGCQAKLTAKESTMKQIEQLESLHPVFLPALEHFMGLGVGLEGEEAGKMEHAEIESLISEEGKEILRFMFQAHLDPRGSREVREET